MDDMGRYDIQWVGHCTKDGSNKIWGWMYYRDPTIDDDSFPSYAYTFWGAVGKTPQFKKFETNDPRWYPISLDMIALVHKKINRNYEKVSVGTLLKLFPNMFDKFEDKFIFNLLADNFK